MTPAPRGQVLIIGAVAMAVLLGIAALVIDLGFSWMLRRQEQNAVDPAAVAAARYLPSGDWDAAWAEAPVVFGPGSDPASECGGDALAAKLRAAARNSSPVPPRRPVIRHVAAANRG